MRKIIVFLLFSIAILAFSGAFTETVDKIIDIAETCQENLVFTEELYDLSTGKTWGIATYIPLDSNIQLFSSMTIEKGVSGFLVIKFVEDSTSIKLLSGDVKLTGKSSYSNAIIDDNPEIYLITDNFYIDVDRLHNGYFFMYTDKEYVVLLISTTSLQNNHDYVVSFKTATTVATWNIRKNDSKYQKFLDIIKEKQSKWENTFATWGMSMPHSESVYILSAAFITFVLAFIFPRFFGVLLILQGIILIYFIPTDLFGYVEVLAGILFIGWGRARLYVKFKKELIELEKQISETEDKDELEQLKDKYYKLKMKLAKYEKWEDVRYIHLIRKINKLFIKCRQ